MFTSDINKSFLKTSCVYLLISIFLALFGAVYEHFSHGVYSYFMIYAFAIPLVFGTLLYFTRALTSKKKERVNTADILYGSAIAVFTAGSISKGVLDIYGTANSSMKIYPIFGIILLAASIAYKTINSKKA